jgi:hypothetical protein
VHLVEAAVADRLEDLIEREARRDRLAHLVERHGLLEAHVLRDHPLLVDAAADDVDDLLELERLEDVVVSAALHRVDRCLDRAEAGHDHRHGLRRDLADLVEQRDAAHLRHLQVGEDEVVVRAPELVERAGSVLGRADMEAFHVEQVREHVADDLLVVDDEDARTLIHEQPRRTTGIAQSSSGEVIGCRRVRGGSSRKSTTVAGGMRRDIGGMSMLSSVAREARLSGASSGPGV